MMLPMFCEPSRYAIRRRDIAYAGRLVTRCRHAIASRLLYFFLRR